MLRTLLKSTIRSVVSIDTIWKILNHCVIRPASYARIARNTLIHERTPRDGSVEEKVLADLKELMVIRGPFKGMRYPEARSIGSVIAPKLLGFYEYELQEIITECSLGRYKTIIDIGCAEGYYAVGLGLQNPNAIIYGFDTNPDAIRQCGQMGTLNNISERLVLGTRCTTATLSAINLRTPSLIICDCEGYEKELFKSSLLNHLASTDILIELHEMVDISIPSYIKELFENTHQIRSVFTESDFVKADNCVCEELVRFTREERAEVLSERRSRRMEWVFLTPKPSLPRDSPCRRGIKPVDEWLPTEESSMDAG